MFHSQPSHTPIEGHGFDSTGKSPHGWQDHLHTLPSRSTARDSEETRIPVEGRWRFPGCRSQFLLSNPGSEFPPLRTNGFPTSGNHLCKARLSLLFLRILLFLSEVLPMLYWSTSGGLWYQFPGSHNHRPLRERIPPIGHSQTKCQ
ncbi:hypothetical protein BREVNS_0476 [Brevinematales bacterium NS]|nr:hypothetical protein BREVNS_0476 [Brevinematales bacterium NS]